MLFPVVTCAQLQGTDALDQQLFDINQVLLLDPQNAEQLLRKGIVLYQLGRLNDAQTVFEGLQRSHPEHPTPLVNLAAIYSRQGRLEDARRLLLQADALRGNSFQTHMSLASVNLELALAALQRAVELKPTDATANARLRSLERYLAQHSPSTPSTLGASRKTTTKPATRSGVDKVPYAPDLNQRTKVEVKAAPASIGDKLVLAASVFDDEPTPPVRPAPAAAQEAAGAKASPSETAVPPTSRVPASSFSKAPLGPASGVTADQPPQAPLSATPVTKHSASAQIAPAQRRQAVIQALQSWANAWGRRDHEALTQHYSHDFATPTGQSRAVWDRRVREQMALAKHIHLDLRVRAIDASSDEVRTDFVQTYRTDKLKQTSNKELRWRLESDGRWKITAERTW